MKSRIKTGFSKAALAASLMVLTLAANPARAAVPELVNFQGKLTDSAGTPITASVPMVFKFYTTADSATPVWSETQDVTPDLTGLYSVLLGSATPFSAYSISFSTAYWLGVTVGTDLEMTPRFKIVSSAYALYSINSGTAAYSVNSGTSAWAGAADWATITNKPSFGAGDVYLASTQTFTGENIFKGATYFSSSSYVTGGGIYSTGAIGGVPFSGSGTRFMWIPEKYALRAGKVTGAQWDAGNIGDFSTAFGDSNKASNYYDTVAGGRNNTASGGASNIAGGVDNNVTGMYANIAGGLGNTASQGNASITGGAHNKATGSYSTVTGGDSNAANGDWSTVAGGIQNTANGNYSFAAGWVSSSAANGAFTWSDSEGVLVNNNVADRTWFKNRGGFLISTATTASAAAFAVNSSGNVGIGTMAPDAKLHIAGTFKLVDGTQTNGYVLTSNAAGLASWQAAGGGGGDAYLANDQTFTGMNTFAQGVFFDSIIQSTGGAVPGNSRGLYAVDLQTSRSDPSQVASGQSSVIGGGDANTASNSYTTVSGGYGNIASGFSATVAGGNNNTAVGPYAFAAGYFAHSEANGAFTWADSSAEGIVTNDIANRTWFKNIGGFLISTAATASAADFAVGSSGNVGIGTIAPDARLHVSGTFKLVDGSQDAGRVLTSDVNGLANWQAPSTGGDVYKASTQTFTGENTFMANTYFSSSAYFTNGGIYSTGTVGGVPFTGTGARFMWIPEKKAIRAGDISTTQWDPANIGNYSVAFGFNNTASGLYSAVPGGASNVASATGATAGGMGNQATGQDSTVGGGTSNIASAFASTVAGGDDNWASGQDAVVGGGAQNTASNAHSVVAGGASNTASAFAATVSGGRESTANNDYATMAGGDRNAANGAYSFVAGGQENTAKSSNTFSAGYKSSSTAIGAFTWADSAGVVVDNNVADRTWFKNRGGFVISTAAAASAAAFAVDSSGKVGVGTLVPTSTLTVIGTFKLVDGTQTNGYVLTSNAAGLASWQAPSTGGDVYKASTQTFTGENTFMANTYFSSSAYFTNGGIYSTGTVGGVAFSGAGTRLMWIPEKGAIRAGAVAGAHWDSGNIGINSVAFGWNNTANGLYSIVSGGSFNSATTSFSSVGGGTGNTAGGIYSTVGGGNANTASAQESTVAGGQSNTAAGWGSAVAGGLFNTALGQFSFAAGYKSSSTANGTFTWADTEGAIVTNDVIDRTWFKNRGGFVISTAAVASAAAFAVDSTGKVGIGTLSPAYNLDVTGDMRVSKRAIYTPSAVNIIDAAVGITAAMLNNRIIRIQGNGPAVDIAADPAIAPGVDGQIIILAGMDSTNSVIVNSDTGVALDTSQPIEGTLMTLERGSTLELMYDATMGYWLEIGRSYNVVP